MPKIIKVGDSFGVTISQEDLEALDLKPDDEVEIRRRGSLLEIVPGGKRLKLRPEVQRAVDHTFEKFGPALERLSD